MINYLRIGKIITLHGIKGEVKVFSTSDDVRRYDMLKNFYLAESEDAVDDYFTNAKIYEVESVKYVKNFPILKIKGFESIEEATKIIGENIYVGREDAIKLKSNEFFIADLIGLKLFLRNDCISEVKDVLKTKANSILVFDYLGKEVLVPMVNDFIEKIDIEDSMVIVKTIDGLI